MALLTLLVYTLDLEGTFSVFHQWTYPSRECFVQQQRWKHPKRGIQISRAFYSITVKLIWLTGLLCQYWSNSVQSLSCMWVCVASTCEQHVRVMEVVSQAAVNVLKQWEMISSCVSEFGPFPYADISASSKEQSYSSDIRLYTVLHKWMKLHVAIYDTDSEMCCDKASTCLSFLWLQIKFMIVSCTTWKCCSNLPGPNQRTIEMTPGTVAAEETIKNEYRVCMWENHLHPRKNWVGRWRIISPRGKFPWLSFVAAWTACTNSPPSPHRTLTLCPSITKVAVSKTNCSYKLHNI